MYIYDTTNPYLSLYHDTLFKLGISRSNTTQYPLADFIRSANNWYRRANNWIWHSTGTFEYDDSNYTNLPIATTDLVADQRDYLLPSTAQKIDRVEVKDAGGDWQVLKAFDKSQTQTAMEELYSTSGMPQRYDMVGNSIMLYPAASSEMTTLSQGLKLYFSRDIDEFTTSDTTASPGFSESFHELISIGAAIDYANVIDQSRLGVLNNQLVELKKELEQFYGSRHRDLKTNIGRKYNKNKKK